MNNNIKVSFVSGDKRMFYCAQTMGEKGIECALYGFDTIPDRSNATRCANLTSCLSGASAVILPVPLKSDSIFVNGAKIALYDIFRGIPAEALVFAGAVSEKVKVIANGCDISINDILENENLARINAYITAESALQLLMQNSERVLFSSRCLVAGYGRIGGYTAQLLKNLGAEVTVYARRELSRTEAKLAGFRTADSEEMQKHIGEFDFIINTIPYNIFTESELSKMSSSQVYAELASPPYGFDKKIADRYNIEAVNGSSLPSRCCPESAGIYLAQALMSEFERSGII